MYNQSYFQKYESIFIQKIQQITEGEKYGR